MFNTKGVRITQDISEKYIIFQVEAIDQTYFIQIYWVECHITYMGLWKVILDETEPYYFYYIATVICDPIVEMVGSKNTFIILHSKNTKH